MTSEVRPAFSNQESADAYDRAQAKRPKKATGIRRKSEILSNSHLAAPLPPVRKIIVPETPPASPTSDVAKKEFEAYCKKYKTIKQKEEEMKEHIACEVKRVGKKFQRVYDRILNTKDDQERIRMKYEQELQELSAEKRSKKEKVKENEANRRKRYKKLQTEKKYQTPEQRQALELMRQATRLMAKKKTSDSKMDDE